jgi:transcriptional regulator with XRE-family HTH domain
MNEQRRFRTLAEQIDQVCEEKGIFRRDIADKMGVSHPYISQILSRGGNADHIRQIAKALDMDPYYFDRYHVLTLLERVEKDDEWATEIALLLIEGQKMPKRKRSELLGKLAA